MRSELSVTGLQEDDSKVTLVELGNVIASYFGTTFDFHNFMTNVAAKVRLPLSSLLSSLRLPLTSSLPSSVSRTSSRT